MTARIGTGRDWNAVIREALAGEWRDSTTGKAGSFPFEQVHIAESLDGAEADLVGALGLGKRLAVVTDATVAEILGRRVARSLGAIATVDLVVLPARFKTTDEMVERIGALTRHADAIVSVGSGTLTDSCKLASFRSRRRMASFPTAASMNGYTASTVSLSLPNGFKTSVPAMAPNGYFVDLAINARAPAWLNAAGLADSLCRPTAQIDWWASHRLFGSFFSTTPYALTDPEEGPMIATAPGIARHEIEAVGNLHRVMTLCGFGVSFTGVSNHGSMGEHMISHWIDMFAGNRHPGSTHGQQVGIASLAMMELQDWILGMAEAPRVGPTTIDEAAMRDRYGREIGDLCIGELRKKAFDATAARAFNDKLAGLWDALRAELRPMRLPLETMREAIRAAGGPVTAAELGIPRDIWRRALKHARDIRNRWSFLDLADDAGLLDGFIERHLQ
jgi:glycerol-1-phosphate dehydrogenase [NAD(P)+]